MGPALAASVVISNVIGVGIFTTSGLLARDLGDPRLLLGVWLVGGILALSGALCYAELGANFPRSGGEYAFLREAYGPLPSFLTGWSSLFAGFSAPVAAGAVGFVEYLSFYFPGLRLHGSGALSDGRILPGHFVAATVILALSVLHYRKIRLGGNVHIGLTAFKVGIIAVFIIAGFALGKGNLSHLTPVIPMSDWPQSLPAIATSLIFVMFSYSGWNAASYIAEEIRDPVRNLPRSLIAGTLFVVTIYLAINLLYLFALPLNQMANEIRIAELASLKLFGLQVSPVLNVVFMGTMLGSISAMTIAGPRIYYAMARDRIFPEAFGRVHMRFGTPANAILLQAFWSTLLVFTGGFEQLLRFSGVVLVFFSALTVSCVFVIRRRAGAALQYYGWGYPWSMIVFMSVSVWILVVSIVHQPRESLLGLGVAATGIPFYYYWKRKLRIRVQAPQPTPIDVR